jgi:hypothetical protein
MMFLLRVTLHPRGLRRRDPKMLGRMLDTATASCAPPLLARGAHRAARYETQFVANL